MANKKYRLGNQSEEYELKTDYLGWTPEGVESWNQWWIEKEDKKYSSRTWQIGDHDPTTSVTLVGPANQKVTLLLDHEIIKDAFHDVYSEDRFKEWWDFYIVADPSTPDQKFIIPMH